MYVFSCVFLACLYKYGLYGFHVHFRYFIPSVVGMELLPLFTNYTPFNKFLISVNTLRPGQNGRRFPEDIFKCIFLNENTWIPIKTPLKFVHKRPISDIPALVQIMAWCRSGDKPLSEPMLLVTAAYMRHSASVSELTIVSFHRDDYDFYWNVYVHGFYVWTTDLGFLKPDNFGSAIAQLPG